MSSSADLDSSVELSSWVEHAAQLAMKSPCKSKRGVVISSTEGFLIGEGFNRPPYPFQCDTSERCKRTCGKTAIHAEQAAILSAKAPLPQSWMLHVKARDGKPTSSMSPSCLECSKLILESGISWVLLVHDPEAQLLPGASVDGTVEGFKSDGNYGLLHIRRYSAIFFHYLTAEYFHRIELLLPPKEN